MPLSNSKAKGIMERKLPLQLPETSLQEARALKDFARGEATADQQLLCYEYVCKKLGMIGGPSIDLNNPHITSFNEGRRFCGYVLINLVETPMDILKKTSLTLTPQEKEYE